MNCKPGDLAVIVQSFCGNEGKVVRCLRLSKRSGAGLCPDGSVVPTPIWEIDAPIPAWDGSESPIAFDVQLRPLRDNDGDDETLTWSGKPEGVAI